MCIKWRERTHKERSPPSQKNGDERGNYPTLQDSRPWKRLDLTQHNLCRFYLLCKVVSILHHDLSFVVSDAVLSLLSHLLDLSLLSLLFLRPDQFEMECQQNLEWIVQFFQLCFLLCIKILCVCGRSKVGGQFISENAQTKVFSSFWPIFIKYKERKALNSKRQREICKRGEKNFQKFRNSNLLAWINHIKEKFKHKQPILTFTLSCINLKKSNVW